jgi:hypothetical protein
VIFNNKSHESIWRKKDLVNLILWKIDSTFTPRTQEERLKLIETMQQMAKGDLENGSASAWGIAFGGTEGYALSDLDGEDLYLALAKYSPNVIFTVKKMLSVDEVINATEKMKQHLIQHLKQ